MRYAIKDGEVIEVGECDIMDPGLEGCPYCYAEVVLARAVNRGWMCRLLKKDTGPNSDFPSWCPLPSNKPGSGDIELLEQYEEKT